MYTCKWYMRLVSEDSLFKSAPAILFSVLMGKPVIGWTLDVYPTLGWIKTVVWVFHVLAALAPALSEGLRESLGV